MLSGVVSANMLLPYVCCSLVSEADEVLVIGTVTNRVKMRKFLLDVIVNIIDAYSIGVFRWVWTLLVVSVCHKWRTSNVTLGRLNSHHRVVYH
jgi:hypothetical protein